MTYSHVEGKEHYGMYREVCALTLRHVMISGRSDGSDLFSHIPPPQCFYAHSEQHGGNTNSIHNGIEMCASLKPPNHSHNTKF
ncbi:MAG: hypothetical protein ACOC44_10235 [Promethearchaeia archaeon]